MPTPTPSRLPRLTRQRASDSVYHVLRESILTLVFRPGERLNVADLAEHLGVSLTPVKEAVNRLAAEGLIRIVPRSGTFVEDLSPADVAETFQIREALECRAAEDVVARLTDETLARFRSLVEAMERPVRTDADRATHERLNVEFHTLFVDLCGNRRLRDMYRSLNAHVTIARIHHSGDGWAKRLEQEIVEHRAILAALDARSVPDLVEALRRHIRRGADTLVADLERRAQEGRDRVAS